MIQKKIFLAAIVCLVFTSLNTLGFIRKGNNIKTIVIDAGHGGHDPGCHGKDGKEKEVTLSVALKLGKLISENHPDVSVIYTRDKDVFVELRERANIANRNHADLFISIHCNSGKGSAYGVETFSMGLHRTADNLSVAKRENESVLLEKDYKTNYDGFDPNSPEASIIFTLYQNAFLEQSLTMASMVQDEFKNHDKRFVRGVKQAGFLVLVYTAMPSILIETGFLTHPDDEKIMITDVGQNNIAGSIYRAFVKYKGEENPQLTNEIEPKKDSRLYPKKKKFEPTVNTQDTLQKNELDSLKSKSNLSPKIEKELVYRVQIASADKKNPLTSTQFKDVEKVDEYEEKSLIKYTVGNFNSSFEALKTQKDLRERGYKEAFVICFLNGKRIPLKEGFEFEKSKENKGASGKNYNK